MPHYMMKLLSQLDKRFAFIRGFFGNKGLPKFFTQQLTLFLEDLTRKGSVQVYIEDILIMSNSKPHMLQLIKQLNDFANTENLKLAPENLFSCFFL